MVQLTLAVSIPRKETRVDHERRKTRHQQTEGLRRRENAPTRLISDIATEGQCLFPLNLSPACLFSGRSTYQTLKETFIYVICSLPPPPWSPNSALDVIIPRLSTIIASQARVSPPTVSPASTAIGLAALKSAQQNLPLPFNPFLTSTTFIRLLRLPKKRKYWTTQFLSIH
ncbi:uncharacterized protein EI90DRAFT_1619343 [Cantharellus anzutake]|uniref:uncharacterized protein n=1 Tax=Cantharellus anzutake TaxID=1750568 RepID=UPI0019067655|nr:uncharacterized protein EI90DRAFT_1619343 [Cantharellus anzutake]KAF8328242.1 hypothetical protein EI90DRAFT_1619343 [Cantharellus anzutake]